MDFLDILKQVINSTLYVTSLKRRWVLCGTVQIPLG